MDELERGLAMLGGVVRTATLSAAGFSRRSIGAALASGTVIRPRAGWIALPRADSALLLAVRSSALLSCVTQAERLGLWIPERASRPHLSARTPNSHVQVDGVIHWNAPLIPRSPDALADPVENVLALVASCQPREIALTIVESALNGRLTSYRELETLPLSSRFRDLLAEATPWSDSGLETIFKTRLKWLPVTIRPQAWVSGHRVDFLIGRRLVVQIDGKQHAGAQRESDRAHDALLIRQGYTVLHFGYAEVMHRWERIEDAILGAIARGLHL